MRLSRTLPLLAVLAAVLAALPARAAIICTAIADADTGKMLRLQGTCDQRVTPASTFKIAISLMGYDAGILTDEHNPALPFRQGYPDWLPDWRQTIDPTTWIRFSVVWYSQQVTRTLGEARFAHYVQAFHYGNQDVSGDPGAHNGLTQAWLTSSLKISPLEQIGFLRAIVGRTLPVSPHAYDMTARITLIPTRPDGWEIHGKTGTGALIRPDGSKDPNLDHGWFIGWAVRGDRTLVFVRLIQDDRPEQVMAGPRARAAMLPEMPGLFR